MTRGFFYGWVITGVSALGNTLAWSVRSTFALFYVALLQEFGWGRAETALGYSLSWLFLLLFSPLAGRLNDRFGPRVVVPVGGVLLSAGLALTGRAEALWQYYAAFGVLVAAGIAFIMMPAAAVISEWFVRSRGAAMGIISAGSSLSAFVFYPLNAWLIASFGWRRALDVYSLIVFLGVAPLGALLYRRHPVDVGATPLGMNAALREPPAHAEPIADLRDLTLGAALRTYQLWALFAMWALGVIGYQIMTTHQVAHALAHGFERATIAWAFGLSGVFTAVGNVLGGFLSDRWGREWVFSLGSAIGVLGIWCFSIITGPHDLSLLLIYVAAGLGFGMRISLLTAIPADLFAGRHFGAILGFTNGGGGLGGFIGPFLAGYLFDRTGNYDVAFAVSALAIVGAAVAVWIAAPRNAEAFRSAASRRGHRGGS
ncbi:MAG TPA: MFS transporter [Methylomirabilota bacterium]|nr:MFS transporter [Methylomirabilota bacterium]